MGYSPLQKLNRLINPFDNIRTMDVLKGSRDTAGGALGQGGYLPGGVNLVGSALHLPEFGVSEFLGGTNPAAGAGTGTNTTTGGSTINLTDGGGTSGGGGGTGGYSYAGATGTATSQAADQEALIRQAKDARIGLIRNEATSSRDTATNRANLTLADIDAALAGLDPEAQRNRDKVTEEGEKASRDVEDTLSRNFAARGSLDSTFFAKALAEGTAGIKGQVREQMFQIDQALTNAKNQASSQRRSIQADLDAMISEINNRENQMVTETELETLQNLQEVKFNLDNYLQGIAERQAQVRSSVAGAAGTGANFSLDPNKYNQYIKTVIEAGRLEKAGAAPQGSAARAAKKYGLFFNDNTDITEDENNSFLDELMGASATYSTL